MPAAIVQAERIIPCAAPNWPYRECGNSRICIGIAHAADSAFMNAYSSCAASESQKKIRPGRSMKSQTQFIIGPVSEKITT